MFTADHTLWLLNDAGTGWTSGVIGRHRHRAAAAEQPVRGQSAGGRGVAERDDVDGDRADHVRGELRRGEGRVAGCGGPGRTERMVPARHVDGAGAPCEGGTSHKGERFLSGGAARKRVVIHADVGSPRRETKTAVGLNR
jgi:hypothetical protein